MPLYSSLIDRLNNQFEAINEIISGLSTSELNVQPIAGKWSIHNNIAHLARYQVVFADRIRTILSVDNPVFDRYVAENDPDFEAWNKRSTADLLHTMYIDREAIIQFIAKLNNGELSRTGSHKKYGNLSIIQWIEFFLLHEAHHIFTIFQIVHSKLDSH